VSLFATKSIEALVAEAHRQGEASLKRVLGRWDLVSLGVGAVIGAGIFVLTGQAAAAYAGPAIVLSMALAGIASALAGLCYAEFASTVPVSGSAYTYAYATLGEFVAWIIGWDLVLEYALGAATVAVSWSGHLSSFLGQLGLQFPAPLSGAPGTVVNMAAEGPAITAVFNLPAVLVTCAVTALLVIGVRESATMNSAMVALKVGVVAVVAGGGALFVQTAYWHPFIPSNAGTFGEFGWTGVLRGAAVIFFAFIGFDAVSTTAQEARNPQRDMPIGILGSLAICTLLYMLVSGVMVGLVPYRQMLGSPAPMIVALDAAAARASGGGHLLLSAMKLLVEIGALAGLTSVMLVMMLAQPRIFHAMALDGLLPPWAGRIHHRWRTPHVMTIVTGIAVALAAGFTDVATLGQLVSIGTLFAFIVVSIGVLFLRKSRPELERPFRVPFMPVMPVLSIAVCLLLMASLPFATWERLVLWMAIGLVVYFTYGRHHSQLRRANEDQEIHVTVSPDGNLAGPTP
jgi:APA family basic amino acid/polyamine antiporter